MAKASDFVSNCIVGILLKENIVAESCDLASELYDKSRFGEKKGKKFQYSLLEAVYLLEKGKLEVHSGRKSLDFDGLLKKALRVDKNFWARFHVFKDLRGKGYVVKTALKFGADFRVYDKGVKPGQDHAKWIVYPVFETERLTWHEFSAKNRVAHSTKKKVLVGIVDDEGDVTYYEVSWVRT